jgi:agmatine deiminase
MVVDSQTNFLYLADSLPIKYLPFYKRFKAVLEELSINYDLIPGTKDVWAVDYMPIQLSNGEFVQFVYNPDYLRNSIKRRKTISDVDTICSGLKISPKKCKIVLDGGNLVRTSKRALICDKVFKENPLLKQNQLKGLLVDALEVEELIIIPTDPNDFTGHADGVVRFYDEDTVFINDYSNEDEDYKLRLEALLANAGISMIRVPYNPYNNASVDDASGTYLNFLEMSDLLLVPIFNRKEDGIVVKLYERTFPGKSVRTIDCNEIARDGGLLNCISWNIKM